MKIRPAPLELFHADRQADGHVEAGVPTVPFNTEAIYGTGLRQNEAWTRIQHSAPVGEG